MVDLNDRIVVAIDPVSDAADDYRTFGSCLTQATVDCDGDVTYEHVPLRTIAQCLMQTARYTDYFEIDKPEPIPQVNVSDDLQRVFGRNEYVLKTTTGWNKMYESALMLDSGLNPDYRELLSEPVSAERNRLMVGVSIVET